MQDLDKITYDDLKQYDVYNGIKYLMALGFDFNKNSAKDLLNTLIEIKRISIQENKTIKEMLINECKRHLN